MHEIRTIGIVRERKFFPIEKENSVEVTATRLVEATAPTPLNLTQHEGKIIMISGEDGEGGTIYGANVEDIAGPILSAMVMKLFNKSTS